MIVNSFRKGELEGGENGLAHTLKSINFFTSSFQV